MNYITHSIIVIGNIATLTLKRERTFSAYYLLKMIDRLLVLLLGLISFALVDGVNSSSDEDEDRAVVTCGRQLKQSTTDGGLESKPTYKRNPYGRTFFCF